MSKERLEEAKEMINDFEQEYKSHHPMFTHRDIELLNYLVKQAELGLIQQEQFHDMQWTISRLRNENETLSVHWSDAQKEILVLKNKLECDGK